ncbi:MAG: hypothetical protein ACOX35_07480 [Bacillota bacterium]|jgi:hypothetical protein
MERNRHFRRCVENLCELGPVAKVRWLRNSGIPQWDMQLESRADYIYSIAYDLERAGQPRPFSPQCALDHFYAGEDIPADWPHVLSMIYQIRCNLFHGGKDYDSTQDRRFIKLAQRILWEMWRPEIPPGTQRMGNLTRGRSRSRTGRQTLAPAMLWERALVISGFVFEPLAGGFDLSQENEGNVEYLRDLLSFIDCADDLRGTVFKPSSLTVDVQRWVEAFECLHRGREAGPRGFHNLDLRLMDTYMAGVVRWLNYIGIDTWCSCDGHGRERPWISVVEEKDADILCTVLETVSAGQWRYDRRRGRLVNETVPEMGSYDRAWLFDLAEVLYGSRMQLRELVSALKRDSS